MNFTKASTKCLEVREILVIFRRRNEVDLAARMLELRRNCPIRLHGSNGEGSERRRDVDMFKGAAHRVLAADGRNAHFMLRPECAEKRDEGAAPLFSILSEVLEILLKGQACALCGCA